MISQKKSSVQPSSPSLFNEPVKLNKYLVILRPPAGISSDVKRFKRDLADEIGGFRGQNSMAHIAIASFFVEAEREHVLFNELEAFAEQSVKVNMSVNGFQALPNPGIISLRIEDHQQLNVFRNQLENVLKINVKAWNKNFKAGYTPFITIGKKLAMDSLKIAEKKLGKNQYQNNFNIEALDILRKDDQGRWEFVKSYKFHGLSQQWRYAS